MQLRYDAVDLALRHTFHIAHGASDVRRNLIVSIGAFIQGIAILAFVANLVISYWKGDTAGNDPWDAWTLEWSVSSPPPAYNFASVPTVASRRPLWDLKHPEDPDSRYE